MYDFFTLLSLGLTFPTIYAGILVIYLLWKPFTKSLKDSHKTAVGWMIIGIVINFIGGVMDNIWWGIAWSADYLDHQSSFRDYLFANGVYSNTFFRQMCGLIGALCHIKSAIESKEKILQYACYIGAISGIGWVCFLLYTSN